MTFGRAPQPLGSQDVARMVQQALQSPKLLLFCKADVFLHLFHLAVSEATGHRKRFLPNVQLSRRVVYKGKKGQISRMADAWHEEGVIQANRGTEGMNSPDPFFCIQLNVILVVLNVLGVGCVICREWLLHRGRV